MYRLLVPSQLLRNLAHDIQKKFLNNVLQEELAPIRERRKMWEQRIPDVYDILHEGSKVAEKKAAETLNDVREAMKINYFDGDFALN